MGLLDFLKKSKADDVAVVSRDSEATKAIDDARDAGAIGREAETPLPVQAAEAGGVDASQVDAEPPPVQPRTLRLAEEPIGSMPDSAATKQDVPATVRVFDEFGREVEIPLQQWREMMLSALERAGDDPDQMYGVIVEALQAGLAADVLPAAKRLHAIDTNPERGTVMLGIALMETGEAAGAAALYAEYAREHASEAPGAVVLVNHAKALRAIAEKHGGDIAASDAMLWRSIEADPNGENALGWFGSLEQERSGQKGFVAAMERAAALPTAWLPQVWLARVALDSNDAETALGLYAEALKRAGKPAPGLLLQSMSGDLGNKGLLQDALRLTRPAYDARLHGLPVGNNLIKASLDAGALDDAKAYIEELQRLGRPDWAGTLQFWEMQIKRAELAKEGRLPEAQPELTALAIEGPAWLPGGSPARSLYPPPAGEKVLFLAASVGYSQQPEAMQGSLPDALGRLSRALPLFLVESAYLHMGLDATAIIPWVVGHGFAVMGAEWTDADAAEYARNGGAAAAVVLHLQQTGDQAEVRMRVVPAQHAEGDAEPQTFAAEVDWEQPGTVALGMWSRMAHALLQVAGAAASEPLDPTRYVIPTGPAMGNYLLRLEQLLAVRCAGSERPGQNFLSGEREIVRGQLDLALSLPRSLPARLVLHETLLRLKALRPEIVAEARQPVELLQQRQPMSDPAAAAVLARQLATIYGS